MNQLDLLHALEEIRDSLGTYVNEYPTGAGGSIRHAHRVACRAIHDTYAALDAEAAAMEQDFNEAVKPPKIKEVPRSVKECGSMEDVLSYLNNIH